MTSINELAEHSTYEETVFLLLYGKLPDQAELSAFNEKLISYRHVMDEVVTDLVFRLRSNPGHRDRCSRIIPDLGLPIVFTLWWRHAI